MGLQPPPKPSKRSKSSALNEEPALATVEELAIPDAPSIRRVSATPSMVPSSAGQIQNQHCSEVLQDTSFVHQQLPLPLPFRRPGLNSAMPLVDYDSDSSGSSDEDHDLAFHQAVRSHGADLFQGTGMLYAEPISTPIISQVKKSVFKDIWKNKYVDLAFLLPSAMSGQATQYTLQMDSNAQISITPKSSSKKITNIELWTSAFLCGLHVIVPSRDSSSAKICRDR
ncbi:hypothetical protein DPMN_123375 [Dreissena polymorpha]|uniref:Uncharacterized protein n=1 Tax=Dreissena polymorpha TaxID=45954 RepID=A0A9D4GU63_DREPO|nr:hypothetical protein DPMN_123375 [Dreissena polymorpha]